MTEIIPHTFLHVIHARHAGGYVLELAFDDGAKGTVDLENELWGEIFKPLKDQGFFKKVSVSKELGTICWPNGADFSPEFLQEKLDHTKDISSKTPPFEQNHQAKHTSPGFAEE